MLMKLGIHSIYKLSIYPTIAMNSKNQDNNMKKKLDVIIVGGSYEGL
jgi:hypothetical protein